MTATPDSTDSPGGTGGTAQTDSTSTGTPSAGGMTLPELEKAILMFLAEHPAASSKEILDATGAAKGAVYSALKVMADPTVGLLAVQPDPADARVKRYSLAAKGVERASPLLEEDASTDTAPAKAAADQGGEGGDPSDEGSEDPGEDPDSGAGNQGVQSDPDAKKTTWKDRADEHQAGLKKQYSIKARWLLNSVPPQARSRGIVTGAQILGLGHRPEALLKRGLIEELGKPASGTQAASKAGSQNAPKAADKGRVSAPRARAGGKQ